MAPGPWCVGGVCADDEPTCMSSSTRPVTTELKDLDIRSDLDMGDSYSDFVGAAPSVLAIGAAGIWARNPSIFAAKAFASSFFSMGKPSSWCCQKSGAGGRRSSDHTAFGP